MPPVFPSGSLDWITSARVVVFGAATSGSSSACRLSGDCPTQHHRVLAGVKGRRWGKGNTLGREHRHWFRARFAGNRFRLFFRADSQAKVIVYAWVNDRDTLRKAGARNDPYAVFGRMLASGNPPDEWPALLETATDPNTHNRFRAIGLGDTPDSPIEKTAKND